MHLKLLALLSLSSLVNSSPIISRSGTPLTQEEAEVELVPAGIIASSTGGCTDKTIRSCTSYDGILSGTVQGVLALQQAAGLPSITVTGGTETGHARGTRSHANGFKLDLRHSNRLDDYILSTFTQIEDRGDGFPQWQALSGDLYADEGNHWDITFL